MADGQQFGEKAKEAFKQPTASIDARQTYVSDGASQGLAMDNLLALGLEQIRETHQQQAITAAVLDRAFLAAKFLGMILLLNVDTDTDRHQMKHIKHIREIRRNTHTTHLGFNKQQYSYTLS